MAGRSAVTRSPEFRRVESLPRRAITPSLLERAPKLVEHLTVMPGSEARLRPWQAISLLECLPRPEIGKPAGGVLWLPVGAGKTVVVELLPRVLNLSPAVLIAPAAARNKTYKDRTAYRKAGFRLSNPPPVFISATELAQEANALMLETIKPLLIILDESKKVAGNAERSVSARITRYRQYMQDEHGVHVAVVCLTGTPIDGDLMPVWHHFRWCLGPLSPLPSVKEEAQLWADVVNANDPRQGWRPKPGPLGEDADEARDWIRDRLSETPGVVICKEDSAGDVPFIVDVRLAPAAPELEHAFHVLRVHGESPAGEIISDPLSMHRIEGCIGEGYTEYFDPPPPDDWADARTDFARFVRDSIVQSRRRRSMKPLDTEAQVARTFKEHPIVDRWYRIRDDYKPDAHRQTEWITNATVEWALDWVAEEDEPTILWYGGSAFGAALAEHSGLPWYGSKGLDKRTGRELHNADPTKSMIVSWNACSEIFNLQAWARMGIVRIPSSGERLEQLAGRAHRSNQNRPVRLTFLATSGASLERFATAFKRTDSAVKIIGMPRKLDNATIQPLPVPPEGHRWTTRDPFSI